MLLKGLYTDGDSVNAPLGSWACAKNILINRNFKTVSNEAGFDLALDLPLPVLSAINVNNGYVIFCTDNRVSAIYYVDENDNLTAVINDVSNELNLNLGYPIEAVYKYNNRGHLIVAWVNNNDEPKVMDVTQIILDGGVYTNLSLFPDFSPAIIEETIIDNGGSLSSGAYQIIVKKVTKYGIEAQWEFPTQPLHIIDDDTNLGHNKIDGCPANSTTNKSILLDIEHNGLGVFEEMVIAIITRINNNITVYKYDTIKIDDTIPIISVTISNVINKPVITIEEVLVEPIIPTKAKTIDSLNDDLYLANISERAKIDYQKYANNIKLKCRFKIYDITTTIQSSHSSSSKLKTLNHDYKTFMPREVYCFYIFFYLKKGGISQLFHIPGDELDANDRATSTYTNTGFTTNPMKYEVEDRCTLISYAAGDGKSTFSKWENKNTNYPAGEEIWDNTGKIGDLTGKVRFHRFPSSKWFNDSAFDSDYGITKKEVLGISWEDVYIPDDIKNQISGYGFAYAKRGSNDMTIYGNDYLMYVTHGVDGGNVYYANNGMNNADNAPVPGYAYKTLTNNRLVGNCFDLLKSKISMGLSAIVNEYILKSVFSTIRDVQADSGTPTVVDYTEVINAVGDTTTITSSSTDKALKKVNYWQYVPNDIYIATKTLSHYCKQEGIYLELANTSTILPVLTNIVYNVGVLEFVDTASTYYSYLALKDDIYQNYLELTECTLSDKLIDKDETDSSFLSDDGIYFGDCFACISSDIKAYHNLFTDDKSYMYSVVPHWIVYNYLIISANNWNLRHKTGDDLSSYFPKYYSNIINSINNGQYAWLNEYNQDYSVLNNLKVCKVANNNNSTQSKFPYKIIIGQNRGTNNDENINWANFYANNFYEMLQKHKGEIWKIIKYKNHLLIHQKYTLHLALFKDKIITNSEEIYLGSGNIFDRLPDEIVQDSQGYTGNQSQWASIVCKLGYCFCDRQLGKVFIFDGELKEISNYGIAESLRTNLQTPFGNYSVNPTFSNLPDVDNPVLYNGLLMAYDNINDRLILTKKSLTPKFSYNITFDESINYSINTYFYYQNTFYKVVSGSPTGFYLTSAGLTGGGKYLEMVNWNDVSLFDDNSFTLSYSPILNDGAGGWVCNHDYYPNNMFNIRNRNYIIRNGLDGAYIYRMNSKLNRATYFLGTVYKSYIDYLVNIEPEKSKILNAVSWDSNVIALNDSYKKILEDETLTHIMIYTNNQCTDIVALVKNPQVKKNISNVKETWFFNEFRDIVKDKNLPFLDVNKQVLSNNINANKAWFNKNLLISKFFIIRFQYDNTVQRHIDLIAVNFNLKQV